jgi:hypothetical protein
LACLAEPPVEAFGDSVWKKNTGDCEIDIYIYA